MTCASHKYLFHTCTQKKSSQYTEVWLVANGPERSVYSQQLITQLVNLVYAKFSKIWSEIVETLSSSKFIRALNPTLPLTQMILHSLFSNTVEVNAT